MSLYDIANDAVARQKMIDETRQRMREQAAHAGGNVRAMPEQLRQVLDNIDLVELEAAKRVQVEEEARRARPKTTPFLIAGPALGVVSLVASSHGVSNGICVAVGLVGAVTTAVAGMIRLSCSTNVDWAAKRKVEQDNKLTELSGLLDESCRKGRAENEARLITQLGKGGQMGLSLLENVERDPSVLVAAQRVSKTETAFTHLTAAISGDRKTLFDAEPVRMKAVWAEKGSGASALALLGLIGFSIGVGVASNYLLGPKTAMWAGLGAAVAAMVPLRPIMVKLMNRSVEKSMRREIGTELAALKPQLQPSRQALDAAQQAAMEHYSKLIRDYRANPTPVQPGTVTVEDGHVDLGGVRVDTKR